MPRMPNLGDVNAAHNRRGSVDVTGRHVAIVTTGRSVSPDVVRQVLA